MSVDRKLICSLLVIIFICSIILIIKIVTTPEYDSELYAKVYEEYEEILENIENNNASYNGSNLENCTDDKTIYKGSFDDDKCIVAGKIAIPKIDVSYPVINKSTEEYLNIAPSRFFGPKMNEVGNLCIAGHNNKNEEFFSRLKELSIGDSVFLTSNTGKIVAYKVYKMYEVEETDMSCTSQNTDGNIEVTLITCAKNNRNRLVVKCRSVTS